jgi:YidC/Oxa1 family membrane protein insertase
MGTSTVSPGMMNAFKWGLPALTVIFTWWQPAALQLTFFISGLLSFGQASLFRTEWFRKFFNMTPIPKPAGDASAPPSPYKGRLKVAASPVLSQAELSQRFQGAQSNAPLQGTVSKIRGARPSGSAIGKVISTTFKDVSSVVKDVTGAGSGVVEKANKMMDRRKEKADLQERKAYEVKKQEQLKKERWEKERDRLAMRATRQVKR